MNKKILIIAIVVLALSMISISLVQATPLENNNDKFQTYSVTAKFFMPQIAGAEHIYTPSFEDVNKLVISVDETFISYDMTIGDTTCKQNQDFKYAGHSDWVYVEPIFTEPTKMYPYGGYQIYHLFVDYSYTFLPASGIEGTLNLRATPGGITSLSGTGDLQNVQIKAVVSSSSFNATTYVLTIHHDGWVTGWPE